MPLVSVDTDVLHLLLDFQSQWVDDIKLDSWHIFNSRNFVSEEALLSVWWNWSDFRTTKFDRDAAVTESRSAKSKRRAHIILAVIVQGFLAAISQPKFE
jgi:hypothetical protein